MVSPVVSSALEKIAQGWHELTALGEDVAPAAAAVSPLVSKIMGLASAGNPLTAASEAALSVLVDVFKDAEAHRAGEAPPVRTGSPGPDPLLPIEAQAAAAVAAPGGPVSDSAAPATPDVVTAGDQVVSAG